MASKFRENHFIWMTIALVGLLLAGAISREFSDNVTLRLIEYSSIGLLLLSLVSVKTDFTWIKRFAVVLALLLASVITRGATNNPLFEYAYLLLLLAFLLMAAWLVASQVLLTGSVDLNKIIGAIALYLLLGLIWSILYVFVLEYQPDALRGIEAGSWYDNLSLTTYFSFVTLTTLGYGDIVPTTPQARVLSTAEAVFGQLFVAIFIARLVGLQLSRVRDGAGGGDSPRAR